MQDQDSPLIFLSYANPDQQRVTPFFESLKNSGFNVWYDCKQLKPGQNWDFEIKRALDKSIIVITFLSENSITRRGYVQREIKIALDKLSEKLIDDIYIIPVKLDDDIQIPEQLKGIQCISANAPNCMASVEEALTFQLSKLGVETLKLQRKEELSWSFYTKKEVWDGLPGYEVELQFIKLLSSKYPALHEIGEYVQGELLKSLFSYRMSKLDQSPDRYNYGQDIYHRTDTYDAHCLEPSIKGRAISIPYSIYWYGSGAAHPNMHFCTYSFLMEPLILVASIQQILTEEPAAFLKLQEIIRLKLKNIKLAGSEIENDFALDAETIDSGTSNWTDFNSFLFKESGIEFLFEPYHVAAYVFGSQFVEITYLELIKFIRPEYRSALDIEYLSHRI